MQQQNLGTFSRVIARRGVEQGIIVWLITCTLLLGLPQITSAIGTFISAPQRVDMVYDDARSILYITSGDRVLRYHRDSATFLNPFVLGGQLRGIDLSPDGNTLAVADESYTSQVWVYLIDLQTEQTRKASFQGWSTGEGGTYAVAFGNDGAVLISSANYWSPLRRYDPRTGQASDFNATMGLVAERTMLRASADGTVIGFEEGNISDGRFGRYRVADGDLLHKTGYQDGTGSFNYEMAANHNGTQYAVVSNSGWTFIMDANLVKIMILQNSGGAGPIGVVYHPTRDIVYFA